MPRRTRAGLTRDRVLQAGLKLVDEEGVTALTMRRLGKELGVEAMSLYTYVSSKQDLLDGVLECVYEEMPKTVTIDGPWQERLRSAARDFREVLLQHPNTVGLLASRPVRSDGSLNLLESSLGELRTAGLSIEQADQILTVMVSFTVGHVASEVGDAERRPLVEIEALHRPIDRNRFPNVAERADLGPADRDAEYALGLEFIVAGIERVASTPIGA